MKKEYALKMDDNDQLSYLKKEFMVMVRVGKDLFLWQFFGSSTLFIEE